MPRHTHATNTSFSDDDVNGTQNIVLNDEIVAHPDVPGKYCRETLSLEMDYSKGKWRKIKRRWKSPIDVEKLAEVGIPVAESGRDDGQEPEEARFDGGMAGGEEGPDEDADGEPEEADADADADGDAELSVDAGMDDS